MESAPVKPTREELDQMERRSLWSCAFQNVFASSRRPDTPNLATRPQSFVETGIALKKVWENRDMHIPERRNAIPVLLRECLAQMLAAGYVPSDRRRRDFFDALVAGAATPVCKGVKRESYLKGYGHRQYGRDPRDPWRPPSLQYLAEHPSTEVAFRWPTEISYDGRAYAVRKEILLRCPMAELAKTIDPANWWTLGPFFEKIEADKRRRGLRGSWDGMLNEIFRIDWNGFAMERFDVRLRIDYTATDDIVRADYSLLHDEDDQLLCDDGLVELRKVPGYSDWCRFTTTKSLKFAADFLNVLAPGVLFMDIERSGMGIEAAAIEVAARLQGTSPRGKASVRRRPNTTRRRSRRAGARR